MRRPSGLSPRLAFRSTSIGSLTEHKVQVTSTVSVLASAIGEASSADCAENSRYSLELRRAVECAYALNVCRVEGQIKSRADSYFEYYPGPAKPIQRVNRPSHYCA